VNVSIEEIVMSEVTAESIVTSVKSRTKLLKNIEQLDAEKPLSEQGVDSLDLSELLLVVEEEFGVEIPDDEIENLGTLRLIVDYINKNS